MPNFSDVPSAPLSAEDIERARRLAKQLYTAVGWVGNPGMRFDLSDVLIEGSATIAALLAALLAAPHKDAPPS